MVSAQSAPAAVQWAQCENVNCQKWRRLPPGTVVDENAAWYCYMNPDPERNTCSADEAVGSKGVVTEVWGRQETAHKIGVLENAKVSHFHPRRNMTRITRLSSRRR